MSAMHVAMLERKLDEHRARSIQLKHVYDLNAEMQPPPYAAENGLTSYAMASATMELALHRQATIQVERQLVLAKMTNGDLNEDEAYAALRELKECSDALEEVDLQRHFIFVERLPIAHANVVGGSTESESTDVEIIEIIESGIVEGEGVESEGVEGEGVEGEGVEGEGVEGGGVEGEGDNYERVWQMFSNYISSSALWT